jgi:hypothetical protein
MASGRYEHSRGGRPLSEMDKGLHCPAAMSTTQVVRLPMDAIRLTISQWTGPVIPGLP